MTTPTKPVMLNFTFAPGADVDAGLTLIAGWPGVSRAVRLDRAPFGDLVARMAVVFAAPSEARAVLAALRSLSAVEPGSVSSANPLD